MDGKKSKEIEISDKIFSLAPKEYVIQSIVDWQLNHYKARTAKTKQRNEIKGSTAKNLFLNLLKKNKNTIYVDKENLLDKHLYKHTSHKQLIIFMGAGSISKMAYNFIKK